MHKINLTVAQNKILSKAGITCAEQLIRQIPNRYNDCRNIYSIGPNVINQTRLESSHHLRSRALSSKVCKL